MIARNVEAAERAARLAALLVATVTNGRDRQHLTEHERDTLTERGEMLHAIADDLEDVRAGVEGTACRACGSRVMDEEACPNVRTECLDCCGCPDHAPTIPDVGALAEVEARHLPHLVALGPVLLDLDGERQGFERFAEVLAAEEDRDGLDDGAHLPWDIVVSLPGESRAYAPGETVRIVRVDVIT